MKEKRKVFVHNIDKSVSKSSNIKGVSITKGRCRIPTQIIDYVGGLPFLFKVSRILGVARLCRVYLPTYLRQEFHCVFRKGLEQ